MRRGPTCRAGLGLLTGVLLVAVVVPRSGPRLDLLDPDQRAAEITEFALRTLATMLSGYLALVFLGLLLSAGRVLPASARALVVRWTARGVAGGLRRLVGISALTLGVLPFHPAAAHAAEVAPVLAPDDLTPPSTAAPRLEPAPIEPVPFEPPGTPDRVPDPPRPVPGPVAPAPSASVTVGPGDSFWSVAERLTAARLERPVADVEVIEPWLALIEANQGRLTDPDDPDLLFPGQVLRLPD